jgi:hypothetical protein
MDRVDNPNVTSNRMRAVFTDIHFWVPVAVLLAGLLLLRFMQ